MDLKRQVNGPTDCLAFGADLRQVFVSICGGCGMPPLALRSSVSVHTRPATDTLAEPERRGAGAGGSRAPCEVHRRSRPSPPGSWTWLRAAGAACSTSQALADERGGDLPYSGQRGMTYGRRQHDCWWPDIHRFSHYVHAQERSDPTLVDELATKPPPVGCRSCARWD